MDNSSRPRSREKKVTGTGTVNKKGSGLGLGKPVGTGGLGGRPNTTGGFFGGGSSGSGGGSGIGGPGGPIRRGGGFGCGPIAIIAIVLIFYLLRGCMGSMMGGLGGESSQQTYVPPTTAAPVPQTAAGSSSGSSSSGLGSLFGLDGFSDYYSGGTSSGSSSSGSSSAGSSSTLESLFQSLYGGYSGSSEASSDTTSEITVDDSYTQSSSYSSAFDGNHTFNNGSLTNNNGELNTSVSDAARSKFTKIRGNGQDEATILVYMCGTDLESKYGMGTSDIKEMAGAAISDKVHVLVYTGGCKRWQNNFTSNSVNQIYEVVQGGLNRLEDDFGRKAMTDPATLTEFINYGVQKYPADRYELIFWDHGSGSVTGYGYDEKFATSGSMSLAGIDKAVSDSGVKFDFIGFDACLMATLETGLILSDNADYLIASEETEPGTGWYYTNWLNTLSRNTSVPTIEIGRMIADDFLLASQKVRQGDSVTLSVTDLSELGQTVPDALSAFSKSAASMIENNSYKKVSDARKGAKEFASTNRIDQIDVVDFARGIGTSEASALISTIKSAVKYNRTSRSYGDAHGLSIYFPYKRASYVDTIVRLYRNIGMDADYTNCVKSFANVAVTGQAAGGGTTSPYSSLFGGSSTSEFSDLYSILGGGGSSSYGSGFGGSTSSGSNPLSQYSNFFGSGSGSAGIDLGSGSGSSSSGSMQEEMINALLGSLLSGGTGSFGRIADLNASNTEFLDEASVRSAAQYVFDHHINTDNMFWTNNGAGNTVLALDSADMDLVQEIELSVLYDDGEGFIDLGRDSLFDLDNNGSLIGSYDQSWLALNDRIVAYYYLDTVDNGDEYEMHGYVPALVNGELSDILITFSSDQPEGFVSGYRAHYDPETTEQVAKEMALLDGDQITFVCDYYSYEGEFLDNYELDSMIVDGDIAITNLIIGDRANGAYRLTDIYGQQYWTPLIPR